MEMILDVAPAVRPARQSLPRISKMSLGGKTATQTRLL